MSAIPAPLSNLSRVVNDGRDVIRLKLEEYLLHSPPIPTDRRAYLNGDVTDVRKQKFEHTRLPDKRTYYAWDAARQQRLEDQEWDRRLNGVWFFNCGQPTYLTGRHYYYLNYHRYKKNKKPDYREANLEFYWVYQYCHEHRYCYGLYLHTRRRDGKTSRAASIGTEAATRVPNFRFGIASKTDISAKVSVFQGEVIRPMKALRDCPWFMPKLVSKIDPANDLRFGSRSTTAEAANEDSSSADDLASWIGWFLPNVNAIDSDGLDFFFNDEVAKDSRFDAYKRWETAKPQLIPDGVIVGKSINATTTDLAEGENDEGEPIRGGGTSAKQARKFWDNSDHTQLGPGESTESGLFRLFVAANKGYLTDEYGRDTQEGLDHFLRGRAKLKGVALLNEQRRNPLNVDEALQEPVNENCEFNGEHLKQALDAINAHELETGRPLVRRYRLDWKTPATWEPPVRAVPDETGGWEFPWLPHPDQLNRMLPSGFVKDKSGRRWRSYKPMNVDAFSIGVDPVQKKKKNLKDKKRASKYAIAVYYPIDPYMERKRGQADYWPSDSFIGRYNARPENPNTANEELCKAMHLFGCEALVEDQKADMAFEFCEERGYGECLAGKPQHRESEKAPKEQTQGVAASIPTTSYNVGMMRQYVTDRVGSDQTENSHGEVGVNDQGEPYDFRRKPFKAALRDNQNFDAEDTKKSDDTMAELYALSHGRRRDRRVAASAGYGSEDEDDDGTLDARIFSPDEYYKR